MRHATLITCLFLPMGQKYGARLQTRIHCQNGCGAGGNWGRVRRALGGLPHRKRERHPGCFRIFRSSGTGGSAIVGSGAGDFVTDDGSHYRSKAKCLADTDGHYEQLDRDGDGRSAWWQNYCNDYTQLRMAGDYGEDCDDSDPSVSQYSWRDADGDGATVGDAQCGVDVPDGYASYPSLTPDCDDTDPAVSQPIYTDVVTVKHGCVVANALWPAWHRSLTGRPRRQAFRRATPTATTALQTFIREHSRPGGMASIVIATATTTRSAAATRALRVAASCWRRARYPSCARVPVRICSSPRSRPARLVSGEP